MNMTFDCSLSLEEIEKIYEGIYDDHNFTFITHSSTISIKEVEGNQKCIITLSKPTADKILISAIWDGRMRGGAGDGVHIMNLMKGLYEKTGLSLKTSSYDSGEEKESSSWFR